MDELARELEDFRLSCNTRCERLAKQLLRRPYSLSSIGTNLIEFAHGLDSLLHNAVVKCEAPQALIEEASQPAAADHMAAAASPL